MDDGVDEAVALRRIFETEDKLRKRLALLSAMRKSLGKKYWLSQGFRSFPDFDASLRKAVFNKETR